MAIGSNHLLPWIRVFHDRKYISLAIHIQNTFKTYHKLKIVLIKDSIIIDKIKYNIFQNIELITSQQNQLSFIYSLTNILEYQLTFF